MPSFLGLDILSESPLAVRNARSLPYSDSPCKWENEKKYFFPLGGGIGALTRLRVVGMTDKLARAERFGEHYSKDCLSPPPEKHLEFTHFLPLPTIPELRRLSNGASRPFRFRLARASHVQVKESHTESSLACGLKARSIRRSVRCISELKKWVNSRKSAHCVSALYSLPR